MDVASHTGEVLQRGRLAHAAKAWSSAYEAFRAADVGDALDPPDLEALAEASMLVGQEDEAIALLVRAHQAWLAAEQRTRAVRPAFWLALILELRGDQSQAGGWVARGQRLVEEAGGHCVEEGYLLFFNGMGQLEEGDVPGASSTLGRAAEIGIRFADPDLMAFACMGSGQSKLWLGQRAEGLALLDEAMVAVTSGEVSSIATGIVYCALIEACHDVFDIRRAGEWTEALTLWCDVQPDLVPYRGNCQVHRAELLLLRGRWDDANRAARQAEDHLAGIPSAADAHYQRGEVHRLRGEDAEAEEAFRLASDLGRIPQPGMALLRLAEGQVDAAAATIRRLLDETTEPVLRARLLGAAVEILLADGDVAAARTAADELSGHAAAFASPFLHAAAGYAAGAVLLAEDNPAGACETLRRAAAAWRTLDVPYELARTRALLGLTCSRLGDADGATLEFDGARRSLVALGAVPALRHLERLVTPGLATTSAGPLTAREVEVLRLLATGRTNRAISTDLVISEKTVARHVANIFTKLGLSTRSAATAWAYERGLA